MSPYNYAENSPIGNIDLWGLQKVNVNEQKTASVGSPGTATATISLDYQVVTQGKGAVSGASSLNTSNFKATMSKGNTTMYVSSLPSGNSKMALLSPEHSRWARIAQTGSNSKRRSKFANKLSNAGVSYYALKVKYNYNLSLGTTLSAGSNWMSQDLQGRGLIFEGFPRNYSKGDNVHMINLNQYANRRYSEDSDIGGASTNEGVFGFIDNFISINPSPGSAMTLSLMEKIIHESGHNAAYGNVHSNSKYKYSQYGLQSNVSGRISPSFYNTLSILYDSSNF